MKLEISNKKKNRKRTNTWRLNNMLLKSKWVDEKLKRRSKNMLKQMKIKAQFSKNYEAFN